MAKDDSDLRRLQAVLEAAAPPDLELASRAMFGGRIFYARGLPFALIWRGRMALKLSGADHAEFATMPGATPLVVAEDKPPSRSYSITPAALLEDRELLRGWIARAAANAQPSAKRRSRKI